MRPGRLRAVRRDRRRRMAASWRCRRSSPCRAWPRPPAAVGVPVKVGLAGISRFGGFASRRAHAGRPCAAPAFEPPARPMCAHRCAVVRAVERLGADRSGTSTSIPPTASISSSNRSKSTNATWLTSRPVSSSDRTQRERRPANLVGGVDLGDPDLGDLDLEIPRDREKREPSLAGVRAEEHDRVGAVCALPAGAGCRRPCRARGSSSVSKRAARPDSAQLPSYAGRDTIVRVRDAAARPRGSR